MGAKRMTTAQTIQIHEMLKKHLEKTDVPGVWRFINGASDHSIAAEMRIAGVGHCTNNHVARVRSEMFGSLHQPHKKDTDLYAELERNMARAMAKRDIVIEELQTNLTMVMDYLTRTEGTNWVLERFKASASNVGVKVEAS